MPKRERSWDDDYERQMKQYVTERKLSAESSQRTMEEIYEKTFKYLFDAARKQQETPSSTKTTEADADLDMSVETLTDCQDLQGVENQVPNSAPVHNSPCNCKSKCKCMRQTTLEQFWLAKKGRELKIQEGVMSPNHRSKGTRTNKLWPLTSL